MDALRRIDVTIGQAWMFQCVGMDVLVAWESPPFVRRNFKFCEMGSLLARFFSSLGACMLCQLDAAVGSKWALSWLVHECFSAWMRLFPGRVHRTVCSRALPVHDSGTNVVRCVPCPHQDGLMRIDVLAARTLSPFGHGCFADECTGRYHCSG